MVLWKCGSKDCTDFICIVNTCNIPDSMEWDHFEELLPEHATDCDAPEGDHQVSYQYWSLQSLLVGLSEPAFCIQVDVYAALSKNTKQKQLKWCNFTWGSNHGIVWKAFKRLYFAGCKHDGSCCKKQQYLWNWFFFTDWMRRIDNNLLHFCSYVFKFLYT